MKKLLLSLVLVFGVFFLVSCDEAQAPQFGEAWGLGHDAVAYATVTTDESGNISEATFAEYFLPGHWAEVDATEESEGLVVAVGSAFFANYVSIDGDVFELSIIQVRGADAAEYVKDGVSVADWVDASEANAKAYVDAVASGDLFVSDAAGVEQTALNGDHELNKYEASYWEASMGVGLGYEANIDALIAFVEGGVVSADDVITQDEETGEYSVNDVAAGATNSDFEVYYALLVQAFEAKADITE